MSQKNKSVYAILSILNLSPCSGYDIKNYSDKVLSGFWNENFGHIYPTLKKMLEAGFIEIVSKEENDKKIKYGITDQGKKELEEWFLEETVQQPVRSEFMLKLFFSNTQPREQVLNKLKAYKVQHDENLKRKIFIYKQVEAGAFGLTKDRETFYKIILNRAILSDRATLKWCDETIKELGNL